MKLPSRDRRSLPIAIDTETTGTDLWHGCKPFAASICYSTGKTKYFQWKVDPFTREVLVPAGDVLSLQEIIDGHDTIVFHNAKFDIRALGLIGVNVRWEKAEDTLLMSHVLDNADDHGLKSLAFKYLDITEDDQEEMMDDIARIRGAIRRATKDKPWNLSGTVAWDSWIVRQWEPKNHCVETYCVRDSIRTLALYDLFSKALTIEKLWDQYRRERRLQPVVYRMENTGVHINLSRLNKELKEYSVQAEVAEKKLASIAKPLGFPEFNPRSSQQVGKLLFETLRLPIIKFTDSKKPSVDEDSIDKLVELVETTKLGQRNPQAVKFLKLMTDYRGPAKKIGYLQEYKETCSYEPSDPLYQTNRAHCGFNQTGTDTTRFSCSRFNLQNVDELLRVVFGPERGKVWFDADYSNLEMRIFSWLAGEKELIEAYERGEEAHLAVARLLYGPDFGTPADCKRRGVSDYKKIPEYKWVKNGNFSLIYGSGMERADTTYHYSGAYSLIRRKFTKIDSFMNSTIREAKLKGFIKTKFGYRLYIPSDRYYAAVNYLIQGTAGDILKEGMLNYDRATSKTEFSKTNLVMTVHDELVFESPVASKDTTERIARSISDWMSEPGDRIGIPTPVNVSLIESNWAEGKKLSLAA